MMQALFSDAEADGAVAAEDAVAPPTPLTPVAPSPSKALAYKLPGEGFKKIDTEALVAHWPELLWRRLAAQGLLHMRLKHRASAGGVEVQVFEASSPLVYQARALKAFAARELVLVPFVSMEFVAFADAAKLKRPKTMHPHLPFAVEILAGAPEVQDTARYFLKSPLAVPAIPQALASAFWAVLKAQEEAHANMEVTVLTMTAKDLAFELEGEKPDRRKRAKPTPLVLQVPVLINHKKIERSEVLVFKGETALPLAPEED